MLYFEFDFFKISLKETKLLNRLIASNIIAFSTVICVLNPVQADYCSQYSNTMYCSDGTRYTRYGNTVYGSDGSRFSTYGNTTYDNQGNSWSTYGNTTYGSDGSRFSTYGNTTYGISPSNNFGNYSTFTCSTYNNTTYC